VSERPFEDLRILKVVPEILFELGERFSLFFVHAAMLLRPSHHLSYSRETDVDLLTVSSRPVHPSAAAAAAEPLGCFHNIWWDHSGHLFSRHVFEDTVAVAAARPFEILGRRKSVPVQNLSELGLEDARVHHLGLRPCRRELVVAGEQPAILSPCDPGELRILGLGTQIETIVATQTEPTGE
jgi:hypothetical protein